MNCCNTELWRPVSLRDCVTFQTGKLNSNAATVNGAYLFFTCSQEIYRTDTFSFDTECVLLAGNNANGVYPLWYFKGKFDAYQRTYIIRSSDTENLDNRYLYFALRLKLELLRSMSTGVATKFLTRTILDEIRLELPPIKVQRRIASILSAYDDLIENNTRRTSILEQLAQMIYREWFVNFRFPGYKKVEMVKSELGPIPKDWKVGTVSNLVRVSREGITPEHFGEETFSHFSIPAFDQGCMPLPEKGKTIMSNKYMVVQGCVLLSKLNPRIPRIWIPVVEGPRRAIASTEFLVLIPASADARNYLFQFLRSDEFQGQFTSLSLGTSTSHQRVKPDDFAQMPISLPPPQLVSSFGSVIEPMLRQTEALRKKNANLRETRDLLLRKLISGEVSVEQFEAEAVAQGV